MDTCFSELVHVRVLCLSGACMQLIEVLEDLENEVATGGYINSLGDLEVTVRLPHAELDTCSCS